jgi:hypothetical protein
MSTDCNVTYGWQIRYIAGMISGYDLLKGPYASLVPKVRPGFPV